MLIILNNPLLVIRNYVMCLYLFGWTTFYRAEIHQMFELFFWKIEDNKKSF